MYVNDVLLKICLMIYEWIWTYFKSYWDSTRLNTLFVVAASWEIWVNYSYWKEIVCIKHALLVITCKILRTYNRVTKYL